MRKLKAIRNHIIFQFEEGPVVKTSDGLHRIMFEEVTDWGFTSTDIKASLDRPRWAIVIAVGHECTDTIKPGMKILIENLKWTNACWFDDEVIWRTDDTCVLAYDENSC